MFRFGRKREGDQIDSPQNTTDPCEDVLAAHRSRALELMGLGRTYNTFTGERKDRYLKTEERKRAFDNIDTSTMPRESKIDQKKGIISEVIEQGLAPEEVLRNYPTLYLGSGTDIEYPLALGSRKVIMVDIILKSPELQLEIEKRVKALINRDVHFQGNVMIFPFDFGSGLETVEVRISPTLYSPPPEVAEIDRFNPPSQIGVILEFATQGPMGQVELGQDLKSRLVRGGVILEDNKVITIEAENKEEKVVELGRKG